MITPCNKICRICKCNNMESILLHGVHHAIIGEFKYMKCNTCGCIQIEEFPQDMSRYYASDYYSMHKQKKESLSDKLILSSLSYSVFKKGIAGRLIQIFHPHDDRSYLADFWENSSILDVGCGSGYLLNNLSKLRFKNLYGCDPFIDSEIQQCNVHIYKKDIMQMAEENLGKYDLIMFNHSLEHVQNPLENLMAAKQLLSEAGTIVVALPVITDFYWQKYGTDFYVLDPPLHFFSFTPESIRKLFSDAGLIIEKESCFHDPIADLTIKMNKTHGNNYHVSLKDNIVQSFVHSKELKYYKKNKIGFNYTYVLKPSEDKN